MNYFLIHFQIALTQRLRNIKSWLLLLLLPLLLLVVSNAIPPQQISAPVQVGVVLPEEGGEEFWNLLSARSGTVLVFHETDEQTLNRNIATGTWDCGLILAEDFTEKIQNGKTERLFTVRIGEGSAVYPLIQETVSSCVAALVRFPIGYDYLISSQIAENMDSEEIRLLLQQELGEEERVVITMYTQDGESLHPFQMADRSLAQFLHWVLSTTLLVWMLLSICDLGRWNAGSAARRLLPLRSPTSAMLPRLCADSLLAIFSGCLGAWFIESDFAGFAAITTYVVFWSCIGLVIAHFPGICENLPILPAFIVVSSLLLSGVLVDLPSIFHGIAALYRMIPGRMYLQACSGNLGALLPLLAAATASVAVWGLIDQIKKR